jgi:hypothetical protein
MVRGSVGPGGSYALLPRPPSPGCPMLAHPRRFLHSSQIFQELIQSNSLLPAGFIACLVDRISIGSMVTKS